MISPSGDLAAGERGYSKPRWILTINSDLGLSEYLPRARCAAGMYQVDEIKVMKHVTQCDKVILASMHFNLTSEAAAGRNSRMVSL